MQSKQVIRLYYGFQFFFSLLLWLPVFYEFQKRIGLSDPQIFSIQSIYYIAFCLLEIPTGLLADLWGYRKCLRGGAVVLVAANLMPIVAPSYAGFLCHFLLIALSRSFISGASSAYLYEYTKQSNSQLEYKQIEGNARAYGLLGKVVCWSAIGVLMEWHLTLPYWLTVGSAAISVVFAWKLPALSSEGAHALGDQHLAATAPVPVRSRAVSASAACAALARKMKALLTSLIQSPFLLLLMFQGIAIFVLARVCQVNLFQPILGSKSFGLASYGAVMALITIFEAIGSAFPGWVRRYLDDLNAVFVLTLVMALSLGFIAHSGQIGTLVWLSIFSLATGFSFPIQRQLLNDTIVDSSSRATLLSVESIIDRAVCALVAPVMGSYLGRGALDSFLMLSAVLTLVAMGLLFLMFKLKALTANRESLT